MRRLGQSTRPRDEGRALGRVFVIVLATLAAFGAGPPDVVRARVPASKVSSWFPAGSNLQVLPAEQFESLVREAAGHRPATRAPRIVRAGHSARWESGMLVGRTDLDVEPPVEGGPSLVIVAPWSAALPPAGAGAAIARATQDGRLGIRLVPGGPAAVALDWQHRARPGSDGRAFALDLPEIDVASLSLELPSGLIPEGSPGNWIGPEPGATRGLAAWNLPAARGRVSLRLRDPAEERRSAVSPCLWLEGPTRIDLNASPANWRADWTLDGSPGAPRLLTLELDPGLELIDVAGPRVASFRVEPDATPTRVVVRIQGEEPGPSPLTIRGIAHAPADGGWPIPSARPIDAVWTGGRTTVRLDPGRVLLSCVERSGRRVTPSVGEASPTPSLVFEPDGGPGPLAELIFRRPSADATVLVRGHLRVDDVPRIGVALTWAIEKGRLLMHAADLPPGWAPDRAVSASGDSVVWHADPLPGGGLRVQMTPPTLDGEARSLTMTLFASLRGAASGPFDLPRVRPSPASGRIVDELWVATAPEGLTFRPILARGLAWIDPPDSARDPSPAPWVDEELAGALAWRWLVDDAEARVDRAQVREVARADVRLDASIAGGRLRLDWTLAIDAPGRRPALIPIQLSEPVEGPIRWRIAEPDGSTIEARPIGLDPATVLELPHPGPGRHVLKGHADLPWGGRGRLPLLTIPGDFRTRGLVALAVEETARIRVDPEGLTPLDLSEASREGPGAAEEPADPGHRRVLMFGYSGPKAHLAIETTPGDLGPIGGVIREACLMTQAHPDGGLRNRLTLRVATDTAHELVLTMPEGLALDRVRRDGQAVIAAPEGRSFRVAIPATGPGRGLTRLTLDYRADWPASSVLRPSTLLPACSLPCLSFVWEVVKPDPWAVRDPSAELMDTDPAPARSWIRALLGLRFDPWDLLTRRSPEAERAAVLGDLDRMAGGMPEGEVGLGDWLVKLDSGRSPVVVDRLALLSSGLGPATRVRVEPTSARPVGGVDATLATLGLVATPIDGVTLIGVQADSPDPRRDRRSTLSAWSIPLRRASATGSDQSDRFQSASRWRGEATPRAAVAGESLERFPEAQGWRTRRLVATGWPSPGASVLLVDERGEVARGWMVAAGLLAIGVLARRRPARARALAIGPALAMAGLAVAWGWPEPPSWATGALRGLIGVLAFWIGRSIRLGSPRGSAEAGTHPAASRSIPAAPVVTATALLAVLGLGPVPTIADMGDASPILALFPFDGPPDPSGPGGRVVMLLDDVERLRRLARPGPPAAENRVLLVGSVYRVSRDEPGFATVEGRFEAEVEGPGPALLHFPVGQARDLSATVDGRPMPLNFAREGLVASLHLDGPGVRSVRVRGSVPLSAVGQGGERLQLPIVRSAFAGVEIAPDARGRWVDVPEAVGRVEAQADGIRGTIGPVDTLEVRWFATARPGPGGPRGPVDAAVLWDARPTGDLVRVRLTHSDPEGVSTLRLALDPGLLVRGDSIPDLVGIRREGTAEHPEWTARIDPPWPRDMPIEVDVWRPGTPGAGARRLPRVEPVDVRRISGVVAFRRPGHWSGRLEAGPGLEPLPESSFVKAWGTLPEEGLTLAGAARFGSTPEPVVVTGPLPLRRVIRPRVLVDVEPGRLKVALEATLADLEGRSFAAEVDIPTDFRVVRVDSPGMVDWQRVARDRLRLQFDGSEALDRLIRIQGYLPVPADPALDEVRSYQARIPWPSWSDAVVEAGTLVISGPARFQVEAGEGVSPVASAAGAEPGPGFRASYRVEKPSGLGRIQWASPRSRVGVSVRSDLTIDARDVTWTAVVDCEVTGGPAESLLWNLPTAWATGAELEIDGRPIHPSAEVRGEVTSWKIQPGPAIWRRSRLVIRSTLPLRPGVAFAFPEISPMAVAGRGSVGRYDLAIANLSGRPMEVAGTSGLQAIQVSQYRAEESPAPSGSIGRAYRVTGERWELRITVAGEPGPVKSSAASPTKVARARLQGTLDPAGVVAGLARYDLRPRPGPYLSLGLPGGFDLPWASVDGSPSPVIRDGPGRWLVVLRDRNARRVEVAWRGGPPSGSAIPAASGSVRWPSIGDGDVPTLLRWTVPGAVELGRPGGGPEPVEGREWELEDAERLAQEIADAIGDLDRGSSRQRGEILGLYVDFELKARSILRAGEGTKDTSAGVGARLQSARSAIVEASQLAGLDDLVQEARGIVGLDPTPPDRVNGDRADGAEPIRLRRVGVSHGFREDRAGSSGPAIGWSSRPTATGWRRPWAWLLGAIGLLVSATAARLVARPFGARGRPALAALLSIGLVLLALEPLGTGLVLATGGLGWLAD